MADTLWSQSYASFGWQDLFLTDPRGYQGIAETFAEPFMDRILLNSPISRIEYDADQGVAVTLDNGDIYSADRAIVTFSLGVLQSDLVTFSPSVPSSKQSAWDSFGMAHFAPILIKWPSDFWSVAEKETPRWYIFNDLGQHFHVAYNLDHADLLPGSLVWRMDVVSDYAQRIQSQSLEQTQRDIVEHLKLYFDAVPEPQDIAIGDWSENPYVRGAYMFWPPFTTMALQKEMQRDIDSLLFFAGEHTYPSENGYVHTAFISGTTAADEILAAEAASKTTFAVYRIRIASWSLALITVLVAFLLFVCLRRKSEKATMEIGGFESQKEAEEQELIEE